jgi:hypothetical protein
MVNFFTDTDPLTLALEEDLTGANGDLSESEVIDRLLENIRKATDIQEGDSIPIMDVARLLLAMRHHVEEEKFYLLRQWDNQNTIPDTLDNALDLRRAIGISVACTAMRLTLTKQSNSTT